MREARRHWDRTRAREEGKIESEGERIERRREHGDQSAAVYPLFASVR